MCLIQDHTALPATDAIKDKSSGFENNFSSSALNDVNTQLYAAVWAVNVDGSDSNMPLQNTEEINHIVNFMNNVMFK